LLPVMLRSLFLCYGFAWAGASVVGRSQGAFRDFLSVAVRPSLLFELSYKFIKDFLVDKIKPLKVRPVHERGLYKLIGQGRDIEDEFALAAIRNLLAEPGHEQGDKERQSRYDYRHYDVCEPVRTGVAVGCKERNRRKQYHREGDCQ
jgi:hypothetical protein